MKLQDFKIQYQKLTIKKNLKSYYMGKTYYNHHNNEPNHYTLHEFVASKEYPLIIGIVEDLSSDDSCSVCWHNEPDNISLKTAWYEKGELIKLGNIHDASLYLLCDGFVLI